MNPINTDSNMEGPAEELKTQVHAKRIIILYQNIRVGVTMGAVSATIVLAPMALIGRIPGVVQIWAGAAYTWLAVGYLLYWAFRRASRTGEVPMRLYGYLATTGATIAGVLWGALGLCVLSPEVRPYETLIVTAVCLLSVGAAIGYAIYLPSMVGFIAGSVAMLAPSFALQGDPLHVTMAIVLMFSTAAITAFGYEFNRALGSEIELNIRISALARDLDREKQQVAAASLAKSRFLAAASHDLRQPAHSINLYAAALGPHIHTHEGSAILRRLLASIGALDGLFESIQDISKVDAGAIALQRGPQSVQALFDGLDRQFAHAAQAKGLTITFDATDCVIDSDRIVLDRIMWNILSNALRYTPRGSIRVSAIRRVDRAELQVQDTGIGIPPDKLEEVFEEFVQLHNPERDRSKGLGLGLSIVRKLSALLGHQISVVSDVGKGTTFSVFVPLMQSSVGVRLDEESYWAHDALEGVFVLIVDDDWDVLRATEIMLRQHGCYTLSAGSTEEALDKIEGEERFPDLVISDLRLRADDNGVDTVLKVRQLIGEPIPALLITGDTSPQRTVQARSIGLKLLDKPLRADVLLRAITDALQTVQESNVGMHS